MPKTNKKNYAVYADRLTAIYYMYWQYGSKRANELLTSKHNKGMYNVKITVRDGMCKDYRIATVIKDTALTVSNYYRCKTGRDMYWPTIVIVPET